MPQHLDLDMPGWYGDNPDEGIFEAAGMKVSDRALNRLKARAEGLLEQEELRRIRKKLGLTQEAAGEIIGGAARVSEIRKRRPIAEPCNQQCFGALGP